MYHGADDDYVTFMPPWRRQTRRPVCFGHDPYNGIYCANCWCTKEHLVHVGAHLGAPGCAPRYTWVCT